MRIDLWWIGAREPDGGAMEQARRHLEESFGRPVAVATVGGAPPDAWDERRKQASSTRLLKWLAERKEGGAERVVGVTDQDLFIPILTFVFGEAQLGGQAAVVSSARLGAGPGSAGQRLFRSRLSKECAHELGHTYGLLHCSKPACVMSRSVTVMDVDSKAGQLCEDCAARLSDFRNRG